ncbi:MAG: BatD family protein [bacterium]
MSCIFKQKSALILLFLLLRNPVIFAQDLQVSANLNRTVVPLDQAFELNVELNGADAQNAPQPALPDIEDFAAFRGTSSSQSIQFINGQMSVSKIFTFHFVATRVGKFQIPPIRLNFKGKSFTTKAIPIEIVKGAAAPKPGNPSSRRSANEPLDLSEQLFLKAAVNKNRIYQNEAVIITYKIYTAVNITNYGISQLPNTVGFWSEEFPTSNRPKITDEVINGRQYRVAEIKKVALYPQSAGVKTLDPLVVDCEVQLPRQRRRRDIFDSFFDDPFFSRSVRRTIRSDAISIEVMPLPEEGKPSDFSGAVGNYSLQASVDKHAVKTNEAITLKVKLAGRGNIKILPNPKVDIPADFEVYDPEIKESIQRKGGQISGSKTFEYVLIPRFPGKQVIKPISFSYFDPVKRNYQRIRTSPITIDVLKGDKPILSAPVGTSKEDVQFIGKDIRFIQLYLPEFEKIGTAFYKRIYFFVLLFCPVVTLALALAYNKHAEKLSSNVAYARSRRANQMALKRLKTANKKMREGKPGEFYSEVSKALMGFIGDKINVPAAGLITEQVDALLRKRGIEDQIVSRFLDCLNTCDFKRFAPTDSDNGEMKTFFNKAKKALIDLDRVI